MERMMDEKAAPPVVVVAPRRKSSSRTIISAGVIAFAVLSVTLWNHIHWPVSFKKHHEGKKPSDVDHVRRYYNISVGTRWLSPDGGRWRPMFVCNGNTPCPTIQVNEGDQLALNIYNDLATQLTIHWSGMSHRKFGFWNDGTGGLNQYPILPRANWTSLYDTTGHWGLNWYADHTGAGVADGAYGMIYVAPSPDRPRPYHMITDNKEELSHIYDAERRAQHMSLWNSDFRTADWKLAELRSTGSIYGLYCYKSVLINGKGRVFCKNKDFPTIDGKDLDQVGCLVEPGSKPQTCTPSEHDVEVIETHDQRWIMLNIINIGFEHALKFSIDDHEFWVVATDAGFVEPQLADVVYVTNGARKTILVKLDKDPKDYAMRIASTSIYQNLEAISILRYPHVQYPLLGRPMELPKTTNDTKICLNADSSIRKGCRELKADTVRTYPEQKVPKKGDITLKWTADSRKSPKFPKTVVEYLVNKEPWQLWRTALKPVILSEDAHDVPLPIQGGLPYGTVIDLIVQNTLNETIPMYKHGDPTWRLGSQAHSKFKWESVEEASKYGKVLDLKHPPMDVVHDLPPLGWLAIRWKVNLKGATMFHAVKLKYFVLGMAAPLLEGVSDSMADEVPKYAKMQPHVNFKPADDGVFG